MTYLLICLAVLGSALAVPLSTPSRATNPADYLLPQDTFPTFYDVQLYLDPDNESTFNGSVSIRILVATETNVLVLHAMEMDLHSIVVRADESDINILSGYTLATDDTQLLTLQLNETLSTLSPPHIIEIEYTARFAENMFGVYRSTYSTETGTQSLITSQLQPTFTRRAFPCYDEPSFKAIFRTTIYAPAAYPVVRSNMPLRNETLKPDVPGYVKHEFEDTLTMSSYLLAYLVSDFDQINNDADPIYNVPFKVFSRPGTQTAAEYALEFGQRNMIALENYTEFPYAFPKMDKAAVPDFAAGAMENWGLVIYREVALLVQEGVTTTSIRQNIARIICHENTHMWFGNEVSPVTWTYTWLNEGFANFFENYATDLVRPGYRMMDQFVLLLQNVMQSDAVLGINPMTHPVYTPSEIISTFNSVAYQKSGSVIRMMQHALTPEIFRRGLVIYLRQMSRQAATPPNLYAGLQEGLNTSNHTIPWTVATVMDRWATQGGFPVITVRRTAPSAESFYVAQERFLTDPTLSATERWHIPINWVLSTGVDFSDTAPQAWVPPSFPAVSVDVPGLSQAEWFIINKQQTGYYRVNYDPENWEAIANVLETSYETIHVLNRAQIVDDSFNLARNGRLDNVVYCYKVLTQHKSRQAMTLIILSAPGDYKHPFEISKYLVQEKDYIPWGSANNAFNYLDIVLSGSEVYPVFQSYLLNLTASLFNELGFEGSNEEHVTAFHRNIILNINCRNGNEICISEAERLLQSFRNNPDQVLNPDIQTTVFCSGLRGGDVVSFNFLWQRYQDSTDSSEQSILLESMGCTPDEDLLDFYLGQVIDDSSPVREQDKHSIVVSVINANPQNMEKALDFVVEHFHEIQPRVQGLTGTTNILNTFARRLNSAEHNTKMDEFMNRHSSILTAGEAASVGAIREHIDASINWTQENFETVSAWLQENYGDDEDNGATAVTSSVLLILSVILAFVDR